MNNSELKNRAKGSLMGLAVGDALGTTVEFETRDQFKKHTQIIGEGPFRLEAGQWTDDTCMALCLAESLIKKKGFDPAHQMSLYWRWYLGGHHSPTGDCFDIGHSTREALERYHNSKEPYSGSEDDSTAGNGSIMRLAPVAIAFHRDTSKLLEYAAKSSMTTHKEDRCIKACQLFARLMQLAIMGESKDILLGKIESEFSYLPDSFSFITSLKFMKANRDDIRSTGYVIDTLEAALWAFSKSQNFNDGLIEAVNLGGDADTIGAVYGQLAGAYYGYDAINSEWCQLVEGWNFPILFAEQLLEIDS